jgi:hypothetical protein
LVSDPAPDITPEYVLEPLKLVVRTPLPREIPPPPEIVPKVCVLPLRSNAPVTDRFCPDRRDDDEASWRVPADTVVDPVYVFAPDRTSVPAPVLVSPPVDVDPPPAPASLVMGLPIVTVPVVTLNVELEPDMRKTSIPEAVPLLPLDPALPEPPAVPLPPAPAVMVLLEIVVSLRETTAPS